MTTHSQNLLQRIPVLDFSHSCNQNELMFQTNSPNMKCTRLPDHWRFNKSFKRPFEVEFDDPIAEGTEVEIRAGNGYNPTALVKNNRARVHFCPRRLKSVASFSDLRFQGKSGRNKRFVVTITVFTDPIQIGTYDEAIKVTADGERAPRNLTEPPTMPRKMSDVSSSRIDRSSGDEGEASTKRRRIHSEAATTSPSDSNASVADRTTPSLFPGIQVMPLHQQLNGQLLAQQILASIYLQRNFLASQRLPLLRPQLTATSLSQSSSASNTFTSTDHKVEKERNKQETKKEEKDNVWRPF